MQRAEEAIPNPKSDTHKFPEEAIPNPKSNTPYLTSAPEPFEFRRLLSWVPASNWGSL